MAKGKKFNNSATHKHEKWRDVSVNDNDFGGFTCFDSSRDPYTVAVNKFNETQWITVWDSDLNLLHFFSDNREIAIDSINKNQGGYRRYILAINRHKKALRVYLGLENAEYIPVEANSYIIYSPYHTMNKFKEITAVESDKMLGNYRKSMLSYTVATPEKLDKIRKFNEKEKALEKERDALRKELFGS